MSSRIGNDDRSPAVTPDYEHPSSEDLIRYNTVRDAKTIAERVSAMPKPTVNEIAKQKFEERTGEERRSVLGEAAMAATTAAVRQMAVGSRVEVSLEAEGAVQGYGATAKAGAEVSRKDDCYEVTEAIAVGGGFQPRLNGDVKAAVTISGEFKQHYEFLTAEGAAAGASTVAQKPFAAVSDSLVDDTFDTQVQRLDARLVAHSFTLSASAAANLGVDTRALSLNGEIKSADELRVKVNQKSGEIEVEAGVVGSAKITGSRQFGDGASLGVKADLMSASVGQKVKLTFKMDPDQLDRWKNERDLGAVFQAIAGGPTSKTLAQEFKVVAGEQQITAKREVKLDGSQSFAQAADPAGVKVAWSYGVTNLTMGPKMDLGFATVKAEAKVQNPGVVIAKSTVADVLDHGLSALHPEKEALAKLARANIGN